MKQNTKQKIIETGAQIIHHKGYNHTGIQEVLKAANVPKGSFYFYFDSKEDFGLHVIDFFNNMYQEMVTPIVKDASISPIARIEKILTHFINLFRDLKYECGCPIGNLAQEMGDLNPIFREKLSLSIDLLVETYEGLLDQARDRDEISIKLDTEEMASFIVSSWHGALIRMKIVQSCAPLENHRHFILNFLNHP
jgi:TetR/AcrR family transcriptional repressor of nem operon